MAAVVIGVGNPWRRDDGAGRAVVRGLRGRLPPEVEILEASGEAAELLAAWDGAETAVVVDAVLVAGRRGRGPARVHRIDAGDGPLPAELAAWSSHGFDVAQAVELARSLGRLPPRLIIYAIEGRDFAFGDGLTPEVAEAAAAAGERIVAELISASTC